MTTIYLVFEEIPYEGDYLLGVFTSKEMAEQKAHKLFKRTRIDEYVDYTTYH